MSEEGFVIKKGEPLRLPSGTIVHKDSDGKTTLETAEQQENRRLIDEALADPFDDGATDTYKRTLADINVSSKQFNPVMLILAYSMWGLEQYAIARFLDISEDQVRSVMASDLFAQTRKEMLEAIRYAEASSVHGYLTNKARAAAIVVVEQLTSNKPDVAMAAAKDVLDRAGFRPADRVEHTHRFEDELRIVHLKEGDDLDINIGV